MNEKPTPVSEVAQAGRLRLPEVKSAGGREEPGGPVGILRQGTDDDPVVGADGGGPVGAARGVFVGGAGPPDVGTAAVDLGVVAGPDREAMPGAPGGILQDLS